MSTLLLQPRQVHAATVEAGAYPSPLNYWNFPKSVCTSVNEIICHGIPDQRALEVHLVSAPMVLA
jgi:methionyl aminopeptidase